MTRYQDENAPPNAFDLRTDRSTQVIPYTELLVKVDGVKHWGTVAYNIAEGWIDCYIDPLPGAVWRGETRRIHGTVTAEWFER